MPYKKDASAITIVIWNVQYQMLFLLPPSDDAFVDLVFRAWLYAWIML